MCSITSLERCNTKLITLNAYIEIISKLLYLITNVPKFKYVLIELYWNAQFQSQCSRYFENGCYEIVENFVQKHAAILGGAGIGVACIMVSQFKI